MRGDTKLPDNAIAEIRQTSLLGEKFVSLGPPPEGASANPLADGDKIPLERTGRNPEVEEVLGALSLLLNGGGVAQLKTIASELNMALEGREGSARSVLDQIEILMTQLDDNKADIVDAIESLNRLAISVREQQGSDRRGPRGAAERADLARPAARRPGQDAQGAQPPRRRRRPRDQGVEGRPPSSRSGSSTRC